MSILQITVYGDSILREIAKPIKMIDDELIENIRDMSETVNKFYDVKLQGQSPTSSLQPANPPTGGGG